MGRRAARLRQLALAAIPGAVLCGLLVLPSTFGYRVNLTPSMPLGVWKATGREPERGHFVFACIPPEHPAMAFVIDSKILLPGDCPGGVAPLLKGIAAVAGDTVRLAGDGVHVNEQLIPGTLPLVKGQGVPPAMPAGVYVLAQGQYWLVANRHANSFDSRYFGAVERRTILSSAAPVVVFGD